MTLESSWREAAIFPTSSMSTGPWTQHHEGKAVPPSHGVASILVLSRLPSFSPPWPTSGGCLRRGDPAVFHAKQEAANSCPLPGPRKFPNILRRLLKAPFQSGEGKGVNVTFSGRPPLATLSKEVPPCYSHRCTQFISFLGFITMCN